MKTIVTTAFAICLICVGTAVAADFGDRAENRLDLRGDRIDARLDARGDRMNDRFDLLAERAEAGGYEKRAVRLDRKGDRIENRLDRKGDRIDTRLDRRGQRIDRRFDRRHP